LKSTLQPSRGVGPLGCEYIRLCPKKMFIIMMHIQVNHSTLAKPHPMNQKHISSLVPNYPSSCAKLGKKFFERKGTNFSDLHLADENLCIHPWYLRTNYLVQYLI
jgi:hypothetical protein